MNFDGRRLGAGWLVGIAVVLTACAGQPLGGQTPERTDAPDPVAGVAADGDSATRRTDASGPSTDRGQIPDREPSSDRGQIPDREPSSNRGPSPDRDPPAPAQPERVVLPAIGVDASVIGLPLRSDGTLEVPPDGSDAGWYEAGARAGEPGPTVIGAHVDWSGEPGAFADLGELAPGDTVTVEAADGARVTYRVDRLEQHPKSAFPTFEIYGATPDDTLRLVTCAGPFDRRLRSHRDNLVVFATALGQPSALSTPA